MRIPLYGFTYVINLGPHKLNALSEKVDKDLHPAAHQLTHAGTGKEMQAHHNSGQVGQWDQGPLTVPGSVL